MTNELRPYDPYEKVNDAESFVKQVGGDIAKSRMFGCENEEQGRVLALECYARRQPPMMLAERYHIIQGRLSMKADAMLADFEDAGGKYEIKEYTPDACEILFTRGNQSLSIRISWEDAQKEKWPYGKGDKIKDNWSTPLGRQDMLWARVVSRGVRKLAPAVVSGRYTPEEIVDFDTNGSSRPVAATVQAEEPQPEQVIDVPFETKESPATKKTERIRQLYGILSIPFEKQKQILADRNAASLLNLTEEQLDDLLAKLEAMVDQSKVPANATSMDVNGPVGQETIDQIKSQIDQAVQTGMPDLAKEVKQKLQQSGLERLADLTQTEAETLLKSIQMRAMAAFFDADLQGHAPKN